MEPLFDLVWKTMATAIAILLVAKLGERGGALIASVVMTFPMNAGPGFFFIALEQGPAFVSRGALISFSATGAVLAFVAAFVRIAQSWGFAVGLIAALATWLAIAAITVALPVSLVTAAFLIAFGAAAVRLSGATRVTALPTTAVRTGWHLILVRGLIAGLVVAGVAEAAAVLGPVLAGLAYAFPTTMLASMWVLQRYYGSAFTLATMARVPAGVPTYAAFCLALHLAAGPLPPLVAWGLAVLVAIAIAAIRAHTGRPRPRAPVVPGSAFDRPPWTRPRPSDR